MTGNGYHLRPKPCAYAVGDQVRIRPGGLPMTVEGLWPDGSVCVRWRDRDDRLWCGRFEGYRLERV